ncbi:MAG: twin transmembrane helix small protein [Zoogloeaceae bacterium]|nr:twin transmembrane helix small protein [Zoogloeaceae bacterium]
MIKLLVVFMLLAIVLSLFSGLWFLYRDRGDGGTRTVRALTLRIGLSIALFLVLLIGYRLGLVPA